MTANNPPPPPTAGEQAAPPAFSFNFGPPAAAGTDAAATNGSTELDDKLNAITLVDETVAKPSFKFAVTNAGGGGDEDDDDDDDDEEEEEELHPRVMQRIIALKQFDDERNTIIEEYEKERIALEQKYAKLFQPLYTKRREVVTGVVDVELAPENQEAVVELGEPPVGVESFWFNAMAHCEVLQEIIEQDDIPALNFVTDIRATDNEDMTGFTLEFDFKENPFFTNTTLTKTYKIPNLLRMEEPVLDDVTGCAINWKPKMNLCETEKKKKQKGKKSGQTRIKVEKIKKDSFFNFFTAPDVAQFRQQQMAFDEDNEEMQEIMDEFDRDYECALAIRTQLVPKAVLYFTGEIEGDDEEEEMLGDDEDDEDDDDEDEDYEPPARRSGKGRWQGGGRMQRTGTSGPLPHT